MPSDPELHITVFAFTGGKSMELTDEISLTKAALLYADRVTLASPKATMFGSLAEFGFASREDRREAIAYMMAQLPGGEANAAAWRALKEKARKTSEEIIRLKAMERRLDKTAAEMHEKIAGMLTEARSSELGRAVEAGVLEIEQLGVADIESPYQPHLAVESLIERTLAPGATTYPMFSELLGGLARAMVKEGRIAGTELAPATQAGVAGRFISALDAFPDAPMDVVLDARGQLRGPLIRFRAGITHLSRELEASGINALDPRFGQASDTLYREHVAPALDEVRELMHELKLLPALARSSPGVAKDIAASAAPLLALAVTSGTGLEALATAAAAGKAAMTGFDVVGRATERRRGARDELKKNDYVFLYEAGKSIA